jgi:hypothetical protein
MRFEVSGRCIQNYTLKEMPLMMAGQLILIHTPASMKVTSRKDSPVIGFSWLPVHRISTSIVLGAGTESYELEVAFRDRPLALIIATRAVATTSPGAGGFDVESLVQMYSCSCNSS